MASVVYDKDGNVVSLNSGRGEDVVEVPSPESACGRAKIAALEASLQETPVQEDEVTI
jgi:hypothetical protein